MIFVDSMENQVGCMYCHGANCFRLALRKQRAATLVLDSHPDITWAHFAAHACMFLHGPCSFSGDVHLK